MSKFVVVIFADAAGAEAASRVLKELHAETSLTLHGAAVIRKDAQSDVAVSDRVEAGLPNAAIGALVGGLIGLLGGPVGLALGAGGGAWIGSWRDISHLGVGADFVEQVTRELKPGGAALVAEVDEEEVAPLDERMEALGGVVIREWRADFAESQLLKEAAGRKMEVTHLRQEMSGADGARRARLGRRLEEAQATLARIEERARAKLDEVRAETDARIRAMQEQAASARSADRKTRIEQRIDEARREREQRAALLEQTMDLARSARA
ncbi:MAG: DUF1269 domain-containing protein [Gammaproteobacteria bacterium]|nr:DUF1269 domain-containing protein [Gammaproteobacteria bacterium]